MLTLLWIVVLLLSVGSIVWGAEKFAKHLAAAVSQLGVSSFALALLLAGAEPEELATAVTASIRKLPAIALGDVVGANLTICLVALGVGAVLAPLPFGRRVMRYAFLGLPLAAIGTWFAWDGTITRVKGVILVLLYVAYVAAIRILNESLRHWAKWKKSKRSQRVECPSPPVPDATLYLFSQGSRRCQWARSYSSKLVTD